MSANLQQLAGNFRRAQKAFERATLELQRALDAQTAAQADPSVSDLTRYRLRARDAQREALAAYEPMERARRDYWRERAKQVESDLRRIVFPYLTTYRAALHAACETRSGVTEDLAGRLGAIERFPPIDLEGDVPQVEPDTSVLDRAEDEVF